MYNKWKSNNVIACKNLLDSTEFLRLKGCSIYKQLFLQKHMMLAVFVSPSEQVFATWENKQTTETQDSMFNS